MVVFLMATPPKSTLWVPLDSSIWGTQITITSLLPQFWVEVGVNVVVFLMATPPKSALLGHTGLYLDDCISLGF